MSAHVTIWCTRSLRDLPARELERALRLADYTLLGERDGLPEAEVEEAERQLRLVGPGPEQPFHTHAIHFRPEGIRGIQITYLEDPRVLAEWREEQRETLAEAHGSRAEEIWEHLQDAVAVVDLELGWAQAEGVGGLFAEEAAFFLGEQGQGLIDFYGQDWYRPFQRGRPLSRAR